MCSRSSYSEGLVPRGHADSSSGERDVEQSSIQQCTPPRTSVYLLAVCVITALAGCDTSVQPIDPSDRFHYSIFGVLNPALDTQWVRVEPLAAPSSAGAPRELDVTVTLEHRRSGQTWALRDSVMEVFPDEPQHNFWTTAPISPAETYRLLVHNEEGDSTYATTTTPNAPPNGHVLGAIYLPCIPAEPEANTFAVRVRDVPRLAALRVRYFQTFDGTVHYTFDWYDEAIKNGGTYQVSVNYYKNLRTTNRRPGQPCIADSGRVIVASGGPDWPDGARYREAPITEVTRPDSFSNVNGGHGMFSGVYSDTLSAEVRSRR